METCTPAQTQLFRNGSAITEDFVLVGYTLKDGSKVFYNQTGGTGGGNGSYPQPYVPSSGASRASVMDLAFAVMVVVVITVVV